MPVVVCLLRGVNVGGHHKIRMAEFRELLAGLGAQGAETYLQSGNAVMRVRSMKGLPERIEDAIESKLGFRPAVILRTVEEMRDIVQRSPFEGRELPADRVAVVFFAAEADAENLARPADPEQVYALGREHYIYFVNGIANSRLRMNKKGTARNWNTVVALLQMAEAQATARA